MTTPATDPVPVPGRRRLRQWRRRGFSAVEVLCTCAIAAVLMTVALPAYDDQMLRVRRGDAVAALTRLQAAQERLRSDQGLYGGSLDALQLSGDSADGLYVLALQSNGADGYTATATAVPGRAQAGDTECRQLVLQVNNGFAEARPSARCWNR